MSLETLILTELLVVLSLGLGVTALFTILCNTFKIKRCLKIYFKFKTKNKLLNLLLKPVMNSVNGKMILSSTMT